MNNLLDIISIIIVGPASILLLYKLFITPDEIPTHHLRLLVIFFLMYHLLFLTERLLNIFDTVMFKKGDE